jgi:hypothetical protein
MGRVSSVGFPFFCTRLVTEAPVLAQFSTLGSGSCPVFTSTALSTFHSMLHRLGVKDRLGDKRGE